MLVAAVVATSDKTCAARVEFGSFAETVAILFNIVPTVAASDLVITFANIAESAGLNTTFLNTGGQSEVNKLIESAVANAGNNPESSKMLANVITKSDAATVGTMLNNIATVSSKDSNSTLAAQVLSSVAITAADSTTSVNTELKDKVNFFIDTVTKTSEAATTAATEAATEAAEEAAIKAATEAATTAAATKAATEAAVTYNAQGFSNSSPFKHKNGTSFNSDGRDYQGYNEAGYNSEGYSSSTPPIYNPDYDVSPA